MSFPTTGAGKGSAYRSVDREVYGTNHDFIFSVRPSYRKSVSAASEGDDCTMRGRGEGKCWGQVENYDILEEGGDMVAVCRGHEEYLDFCGCRPGARKYIEENTNQPTK